MSLRSENFPQPSYSLGQPTVSPAPLPVSHATFCGAVWLLSHGSQHLWFPSTSYPKPSFIYCPSTLLVTHAIVCVMRYTTPNVNVYFHILQIIFSSSSRRDFDDLQLALNFPWLLGNGVEGEDITVQGQEQNQYIFVFVYLFLFLTAWVCRILVP